MIARAICFLLWLSGCTLAAREWHSADGGRSLLGDAIAYKDGVLLLRAPDGRDLPLKLEQLSAADQAYAQAARPVLEAASALGARSVEVTQLLARGALCRMAVQMANGSTMFTGEQFYLTASPARILTRGSRFKDVLLFPAGKRLFHPTAGDAEEFRAFAFSLDEALGAAAEAPDIYEPVIKVIEARGIGYAVGEAGLVLVDNALLADATSIVVDVGKDLPPGLVIATSPELGVSIIEAKGKLTPLRVMPRTPVEAGQAIQALGLKLDARGSSVPVPTPQKGTVKRLGTEAGAHFFEHDAAREPGAISGVVLGAKGDVLGLMTPRFTIRRGRTQSKEPEPGFAPGAASVCLRTEALLPFLSSVPKVTAVRPAVGKSLADFAQAVQKAAIIVRVTKETRTEATPAPAAAKSPDTAPPSPPGAGWSLSKTGTRHNAGCKFYDRAKPCAQTDGKPCRVCGG